MIFFCEKCDCLLHVKEILNEDNKRELYRFCKNENCDYKKKCTSFKILKKDYRFKLVNRTHLNEHKSKDSTLPIKKSKCPKCKKTNINKYERKYFRNQFFINHLCSSCNYNWT